MTTTLNDPVAGHTLAKPVPVLFVALDRANARFFLDDAEGLRELTGTFASWTRGGRFHEGRGHSPGVGEKRYHHIQIERRRRHYHAVAQRLDACLKSERAIGVILAGEHRTVAEFRRGLSKTTDRAVLQEMAMSPKVIRRRELREAAERSRHFMR